MTIPGRKILRNMFGLDYRSLALLRIGLGTLILCNLYVSAGDLRAFYTDEGLLPRSLLLSNFGRVFSLHMAGGSMAFAITIFAVQAVLALLMIAGYRTRIVTIASYVLLVSLQARNPLLIFGADIALRICFFWAMFLPLNRRFSLDAAVGRVSLPETSTYFRIPGIAYLVQFAAIYLFSGLLKTGAAWKVDHTAVSYALSLEIWRRPLGAWLNQFDSLTTWLTRMTPSAEIYGPLLLILPVWSAWGRILGFALFAGLQIGFNACMQMGLFGPVMIVVSFALLPAEFWTYLVEPGGRRCARMLARFSNFVVWPKKFIDSVRNRMQQSRQVYGQLRSGRPAWPRLRLLAAGSRDIVVLFLMTCVVLWNIEGVPGNPRLVPGEYGWIATTTGLDQYFDFFSPDPETDDGWFVIDGELADGRHVNALTGGSTVTFDRPANFYDTYVNQRWSAFLIYLWTGNGSQYLDPFSRFLVHDWNRRHPVSEHMTSVEITFMHEIIGPGHSRSPVVREVYWTQKF